MRVCRRFAWLPLALDAGPAFAHAPVPGIKGFYFGLLHPFSTPAQALVMLGLGLLIGSFVAKETKWHFFVFPGFVFLGLFAGSAQLDLDTIMFALSFVTCATAALFPGRLVPFAVLLGAIGGFLIGSVSIPDDGATQDRIMTMAGSVVGANAGLFLIFGTSLMVRENYTWPWVGIAFRIAAAWLGAIALLMLALAFAGPASL